MGCFYHYCSCREARPSLTEDDFERGNKKREMEQMRNHYIKETDIMLLKCGNENDGISRGQ